MNDKENQEKSSYEKLRFLATLFVLCLSTMAWAQMKVTGTVVDMMGEPIIGANVVESGNKTVGTITDLDGKFTLNVSKEATLVITYVGFTEKRVKVNGRSQLTIKLEEDSKTLDEVIVVGYGSVKKSNLTTSVAKISSDAIDGRPITSLSDALSGQLAGVQTQTSSGIPGEEMQILVRGASSINGSSSPLIVVDGVITESMSDVNPSDVASIQVLKDAAATSIYGARGSAGVVLIETKQASGSKPVITWESYIGTQNAVGLPEMMTAKEWLAYNIWYTNAKYLNKGGTNSMYVPNKKRSSGDQINEQWLVNPNSDVADWTFRNDIPTTDWIDQIMQNALTHNHQVSVSSKGKKYSIYLSAGYLNQEGIVKNTGFERFNFRLNASVDLNRYIKAGATFAPTISHQDKGESEGKDKQIMNSLLMPPIIGLDENTREYGFNASYRNNVNPYERLMSVVDKREKKTFNTSLWAEAKIIKGLTFKTLFSYNSDMRIDEYFLPANVQPNNGSTTQGTTSTLSISRTGIQNTLTYNTTLNKKHALEILLGQSIDERNEFRTSLGAMDYPLESVPTLNMGATPTEASSSRTIVRTSSLFGRVNYNYADKYLASASVRRDGSSRFGPGNRWAVFPSVSAGWKISGEEFMKDIKVINLLKLRASWGMSGNDRIGTADYIPNYDVTNTVYGGTSQVGVYAKNIANDKLKWETTKAFDIGFDLSLFNNRVQLNVDYYINKTDDLLYSTKLPAATGFSTVKTNLASIENKGWEIDLTTVNVHTKAFKWSSSLNLATNKNKVLDMGGNDNVITEAYDARFITKVGGPISQFYVYRTDGLLTNDDFELGPDGKYDKSRPRVPVLTNQIPGNVKYVDIDGNGEINSDDMVPYGSNDPDLTYGFTNRFSYKNLELSVFLRGQIGGKVLYLAGRSLDTGRGNYNGLKRWLHAYKEEYAGGNPIPTSLGVDMSWDGKTPLPYGLGNNSPLNKDGQMHMTDMAIYNASFLRIQNISLTYKLPKKWLRKSHIQAAKVYVTAENLYTFTDYIGNPDVNSYSPDNPMVRGADYTTYPQSRKYIFGVNLTF